MASLIRVSSATEIRDYLETANAGNHLDNMKQVTAFPRHYLLSLDQQDFFNLVFLQIPELTAITPKSQDRCLRAVAERANRLPIDSGVLTANWNIHVNVAKFQQSVLSSEFYWTPLLLRDVGNSEAQWAPGGWYLQDGSHRALAYCMSVLSGKMAYQPISAFCATARILENFC